MAELNPEFENLLVYLRQNRGFDFSGYKRSTLMRRICKRMQVFNLETFSDYLDYLEVYPEEFNHLFNTILINVTGFFRDAAAWEKLSSQVLPRIISAKQDSDPIRIWSAGCATGEEAYTLAMLIAEIIGLENLRQRVKIYASDIDNEALNQARLAVYSEKDIQSVPPELRQKYFEPTGNFYVFQQELRRSVIFGRHDLFQDAPISRLDLLVCRNTLMYFNSESQGRILARFHFALNNGGYLFLGKAEMLLLHSNLFTPVDLKNRIFTKVPVTNMRDRLLVMATSGDEQSSSHLSRHIRLREQVFDSALVAQVVVDYKGILVLLNEQARAMFGLSLKDLARPFQDLEISYRPLEMRSIIEKVNSDRRSVTVKNVERFLPNGEVQYLDVQVSPLQDGDNSSLGVSIAFHDVTLYNQIQQELKRSQQDLASSNEELQSTNEELETTNEELQSTNEELETTNEELQSTNEELETMNEELQSANEELVTINNELSQRTNELDHSNIFLTSILASLQTGIIVIEQNSNILIWNYMVEDMWGLRSDEVIGKSIFSLDIGLPLEQIRSHIRESLSGKKQFEEMIIDAINRRGKKIKCYLALTPLTGTGIEGSILIMADVDKINSMISLPDMEERRQK